MEMVAHEGGEAPSPHFVGCFDHRITLYAQQVKALNLVADLVNRRKLPPKGDVAIVGGGAAGLTIAAALAKVGHQGLKIDLYEMGPNLLHLQRECKTRYLHPHLYDWPDTDAARDDAGLPILNWKAGTAKFVADTIEREFNKLIRGRVNIYKNSEVSEVDTVGGGFHFKINGKTLRSADILFACPGFSFEITTSDRSPSYWSNNAIFSDPADLMKKEVRYFISGNGDGGLVDFSLAAFNNFSQPEIAKLAVCLPGIDETAQILKDIEISSRTVSDPPLDLYTAYRTRIKLRNEQLDIFIQKLRPNTRMYFHTQNKQLFSLNSSILNRFIVFAASLILGDRCSLIWNRKLVSNLEDDVIKIEGEPDIKPHYRRFRFGVDREQALKPFKKFQPWPNSAYETPKLKKVAQYIFSEPMQRGSIPPKPVAILNGSRSKQLRIDLANPKLKLYNTSAVNLSVHEREFLTEGRTADLKHLE